MLAPDSGVLFGTAYSGGYRNNGTIFELTPPVSSGAAWTFAVLHYFPQPANQLDAPGGGLALGRGQVLYGVTYGGGTYYYGTVFALQL